MQAECERLTNLLVKHDPLKALEKNLQRMQRENNLVEIQFDSEASSDSDSDIEAAKKEMKENAKLEVKKAPDVLIDFMLAYEDKVKMYEQEKIKKLKEKGETITIDKKKERQTPAFLVDYINQPAQSQIADVEEPSVAQSKKKAKK